TFCPTDGFIRPLGILHGYAGAARQLGAEFELDCGPVQWNVEGRDVPRVSTVHFGASSVSTRRVVIAAGAWSGLLAAHGVQIPVVPERRQIAVTEPFSELPGSMPMTIDCSDGFHCRVRDGRLLLLKGETAARAKTPAAPLGM